MGRQYRRMDRPEPDSFSKGSGAEGEVERDLHDVFEDKVTSE